MIATRPAPPASPLEQPVTTLPGVGPERARQLARLEINSVLDLLLHRPSRYEDRSRLRSIAELELGEPAITHGKITALGTKWFQRHTRSVFEFVLVDGTGRLHCRWWNLPYMEKYFSRGDEVLVFGRPLGLKPRTIDHPEIEVLEGGEENFIHLNRITPIYPLTEGLPQRWLRALLWRTLQTFAGEIPEPWPLKLALSPANSPQPNNSPDTPELYPSRAAALRMLHFPETSEQPELARRRLALDEFIALQKRIQTRRRNFQTKAQALPCAGNNRLIKPFLARLGFNLTPAQTRVLRELRKDMGARHPMRRLLQGDVGSGKTVVSACCALMALESGFQVALMAPTEILAEQHFLNFSKWLGPLGIPVEIQTGSRKEIARPRPPGSEANGPRPAPASTTSLAIGTHALLQSGFQPSQLGLVIIDEQHKFGVAQREQLVRKGRYPHLLVMTATPIPRTLGLTLYGELDVSVLDELPPGRGKLKTFVRTASQLPKVWEFVRSQLKAGRQAYVVYPRVEEDTGPGGLKAVTQEFETLKQALAPFQPALLHGRLPARQKEQVMEAFRTGRAHVLLATSLVEVGVDVPNATVMLIENAEQFGLAQLHQLRGRIGRGAENSYCILCATAKSREGKERLRIMEQTNDGFQIAEADLQLRGPGELLGRDQSGVPRFRFGDLSHDLELIRQAKKWAADLLDQESPSA